MTGKKITTWRDFSNPDDFNNWNNIDGSDIPERHKVDYAGDLYYKGAAKTFWTPRRRMLNSIAAKEEEVNANRQKRQQQRQAKMNALGETRRQAASFADFTTRRERSEATTRAANEENANASMWLMLAIFGGGLLLCVLGVALVYFGG